MEVKYNTQRCNAVSSTSLDKTGLYGNTRLVSAVT